MHTIMMYHQTNKFREVARDEWETEKRKKKRELIFKLTNVETIKMDRE